ncbi:PIN domain-containing protein [Thermopolyspora sp. NPDC052614]|uniref:PIN domain-containing protein n=1 Tax=Thermopolyspora sp. NPDC052614 TaxID=3155682 RepID=UPI0034303551
MTKRGLTLDSGALIALERGDPRMRHILDRAERRGIPVALPVSVLAQCWRGTPRQAQLARYLLSDTEHVEIVDLEQSSALRIGLLAGRSGHCDVVDLHVAVCARDRGHAVVTSDRQDIAKVDPKLQIIDV